MAAFTQTYLSKDLLSSLSAEVLDMILSYLPAKSLLNVSECNRRLLDLCRNCNFLWKHLCKVRTAAALREIMHAMFISSLRKKIFNLIPFNMQLSSSTNMEDLRRAHFVVFPLNEREKIYHYFFLFLFYPILFAVFGAC